MRIRVVQLHDVVVSSEIVGYFTLERGRGESSPKYFLALDHGFVRLRYPPVQVQESSLLRIGLQFPGKLFLIVLFKLLLDGSNDSRYLGILTFPEKLIHFLIGMIARIQVDKAFQSSILFILFKPLLGHTFLSIISYFFQHKGHDICCRY